MTQVSSADHFFASTVKLRPPDMETRRTRMDDFVAAAQESSRGLVLMTSGGTTVPLEMNTVRFIDNFSTGTRGARCSEEFIKAGYAVILLYRKGSNFPFLTDIVQRLSSDPVGLVGASNFPGGPGEGLAGQLLPIDFVTVFEYLFLLREACCSLQVAGARAVVVLAAAVSDFYVPESEMATEKIQSRGRDGLSIQLRNVPKLLGCVKQWAPHALVISFKLETNPNILMAKAAGSISGYGVDAVCSNLLQTYRDVVTIVWRDSSSPGVKIAAEEITGEEEEPIPVQGVAFQAIERDNHASIETPLVKSMVAMHRAHTEGAGTASLEAELEPKQKRVRI